ncbi:hypothetical protein C0Q70_09115 [Pomacea canaliculata]|uniref:Uncharacterized protein n=1 Tax=Pomacea canaliculata TaxID=400727 RepID=A0A2T7P8W4_POMCA|nr:hypothetical protein C0Q70_09115 [Pomacea canaliculata]
MGKIALYESGSQEVPWAGCTPSGLQQSRQKYHEYHYLGQNAECSQTDEQETVDDMLDNNVAKCCLFIVYGSVERCDAIWGWHTKGWRVQSMSPPVSREPSHRGLDDKISRQILTFSMARLFPLALLVILANLTLSSGMSLSGYLERRASVGKLIGHPGLYEDSQPVAKTFERPERTVDTTGGVSSVKHGDKDDDLGFVRLSFRKKPKGSPQITIRLSNGTDVFPPGTGQLSSKEGLTIDLQNLET